MRLGVVFDGGSVAKGRDGGCHGELDRGAVEIQGRGDLAYGRVGDPAYLVLGHFVLVHGEDDLHAGHFVGGERPRLVGADDVGAPQCLHGGELPHNGVLGGHLSGSKGEAGGDDGGQALGDGRHGQGHRDLEVVDAALEDGAVDGIEEVIVIDRPHQDADDADDLAQQVSELVDLLLEGGVLLVLGRGLDRELDLSYFRLHANVRDDADGDPSHHRGGSEHHVGLGLHDEVVVCHLRRLRILRDRLGFARELALIDAQRRGLELHDARVGRDAIPHLHLDDVPRDDIPAVDGPHLPVSHDARGLGLELLERIQCGLGVGLLPHAHDGVQDEDDEDDDGFDVGEYPLLVGVLSRVVEVGEGEGDDGGGEQDLHEGVVELLEDELPEGGGVLLVEFVPAVDEALLLDLFGGEALLGIHLVVGVDVVHVGRGGRT
mmetsp:Transcript_24749/g.59665  ORF Transcript_24749/g.59665 Transcript_24749/m.59665 type:complete len:432 (+) Transcript_24749:2089-3384(+)